MGAPHCPASCEASLEGSAGSPDGFPGLPGAASRLPLHKTRKETPASETTLREQKENGSHIRRAHKTDSGETKLHALQLIHTIMRKSLQFFFFWCYVNSA